MSRGDSGSEVSSARSCETGVRRYRAAFITLPRLLGALGRAANGPLVWARVSNGEHFAGEPKRCFFLRNIGRTRQPDRGSGRRSRRSRSRGAHRPTTTRPAAFSPYSGPAPDCKTRNDSPGATFVVSSKALRAYAFANARFFWLSRHRGRFESARAGLDSRPVLVCEGWLRSATHWSTMCLA